jgi:hypothetical protein
MSGKLHASATLPLMKELLISLGQTGWAPEPIWMVWRGEESLAPPENQMPVLCSVAPFAVDLCKTENH